MLNARKTILLVEIAGAVKMGTVWLIPKSAQKPKDGRRKENKHE